MTQISNDILILMPQCDLREGIMEQILEMFPEATFNVIGNLEEAKQYATRVNPLHHNAAVVGAFEKYDQGNGTYSGMEGVEIAQALHATDPALPMLCIASAPEAHMAFTEFKGTKSIISSFAYKPGTTTIKEFDCRLWIKHNGKYTRDAAALGRVRPVLQAPISNLLVHSI